MSFTVGKHAAPTLIVIALVIVVISLAFLATAKNHDNPSNIAPTHSQN
jgi:hypothetical protein